MATRGFENITPAEMKRLLAQKQPRGAQVTRSKYGAVKTSTDGIAFDSAKEARRYQELLNLVKAGEIANLEVQPHYPIVMHGETVAVYRADFRYRRVRDSHQATDGLGQTCRVFTGAPIVEDVKSVATRKKEVYRLKKKLVEAQYGIQILET